MSFKDSGNVRLKVRLTLETEAGDYLLEVDKESILPGLFCENALDTAEQALDSFLNVEVISPARGMVRSHIRGIETKRPFHRTDLAQYLPTEDLPNAGEIAAKLDAKLLAALSSRD